MISGVLVPQGLISGVLLTRKFILGVPVHRELMGRGVGTLGMEFGGPGIEWEGSRYTGN